MWLFSGFVLAKTILSGNASRHTLAHPPRPVVPAQHTNRQKCENTADPVSRKVEVRMGSDKYRLNWKEFEENTKSYFR